MTTKNKAASELGKLSVARRRKNKKKFKADMKKASLAGVAARATKRLTKAGINPPISKSA